MIINFLTENRDYEDMPIERHTILCNGVKIFSQCEGMEPEDVCFGRDLESPHYLEDLIRKIIQAVKDGEEITIEHIEREWEW